MTPARARRPRPPLDEERLQEMALRYVGRYATTRSKLRAYLARKLRERGWAGSREADLGGLAERFAQLGYIDDAAFALSKSQSLAARGYGKRRMVENLRAAGVGEEDSGAAREHADSEAVSAALRFAERRRIGPFARERADPPMREKAVAAMVRAGHAFGLARAIVVMEPGSDVDAEDLRSRAGVTLS